MIFYFYKPFKIVISKYIDNKSWKDRFGNNLLHYAVMQEDEKYVDILMKDEKLINEKNSINFTPIDLAIFLNKSKKLVKKTDRKTKIEKRGEKDILSIEELEKYFGFKYFSNLVFNCFEYLYWVVKRCEKASTNNVIDRSQKWMGCLYQKEIENGFFEKVSIRWIDKIIEYGLFTEKKLSEGEYIGEYTGLLRKNNKRLDGRNSYCFEYLIGNLEKTPFTIDARDQGNLMRFINHSSSDANLTPYPVYSNGVMHIILKTNKIIPKGSELTYDYGPTYWKKRENPIDK